MTGCPPTRSSQYTFGEWCSTETADHMFAICYGSWWLFVGTTGGVMTEPGPAEPVARPLPQPSISSEPFWTSGADGRLRIAQCQACGRYHHPPRPICPHCRSVEVT